MLCCFFNVCIVCSITIKCKLWLTSKAWLVIVKFTLSRNKYMYNLTRQTDHCEHAEWEGSSHYGFLEIHIFTGTIFGTPNCLNRFCSVTDLSRDHVHK